MSTDLRTILLSDRDYSRTMEHGPPGAGSPKLLRALAFGDDPMMGRLWRCAVLDEAEWKRWAHPEWESMAEILPEHVLVERWVVVGGEVTA